MPDHPKLCSSVSGMSQGIPKPKRHPVELELAPWGAKCCLLPVFLLHRDLVEALVEVEFGQEFCFTEVIQHVVYHRYCVRIWYSDYVRLPEVNAESDTAFWLRYRYDK